MARWRLLGLTIFLAASTLGLSVVPAQAAGEHRALVVVDTGTTTYRQVITFTEDSVTGLHALELAGATPVVYSYSGQGGAVCRLFGVGRDAGPGCLGGADGDNRYWAYFRAPSGTSSFTYSRAGAGSVPVHDGDVEGWKFGTGQAPGWSGVPAPSTTTTVAPPGPTAPPAVGQGAGAPGPGSVGSGPAAGGSGPVSAPIVAGAADPNAAGSSTTTDPGSAAAKARTSVRGREVSKRSMGRVASGPLSSAGGGDGGGGAGSLALFAIVAAALGAGVVYLRRLRRARGG